MHPIHQCLYCWMDKQEWHKVNKYKCPIGPGKGVLPSCFMRAGYLAVCRDPCDVITSCTAAKRCCGVLDIYNERKGFNVLLKKIRINK